MRQSQKALDKHRLRMVKLFDSFTPVGQKRSMLKLHKLEQDIEVIRQLLKAKPEIVPVNEPATPHEFHCGLAPETFWHGDEEEAEERELDEALVELTTQRVPSLEVGWSPYRGAPVAV